MIKIPTARISRSRSPRQQQSTFPRLPRVIRFLIFSLSTTRDERFVLVDLQSFRILSIRTIKRKKKSRCYRPDFREIRFVFIATVISSLCLSSKAIFFFFNKSNMPKLDSLLRRSNNHSDWKKNLCFYRNWISWQDIISSDLVILSIFPLISLFIVVERK